MSGGKHLTVHIEQVLETYDGLGRTFFEGVLGLDWDQVLFTAESTLSDFSFSGNPPGLLDGVTTLNHAHDLWDMWVLEKVFLEYGVKLKTTNVTLSKLFEEILAYRKAKTMLH